jgi:integrase
MAKIRRRGHSWLADCSYSGTRFKRTFETRREAEEFAREFELKKMGELGSSPMHRMTIENSIAEYVAQFTSEKALVTQANEKKYLEQFKKFFSGVSGATVNRQFNSYKHYITQARLWKHTKSDPCFGLKSMKFTPKQKKLWKDDDIWRVRDLLPMQWHKDAVFLLAKTGIRPIELCRLRWDDVDLEERVIRIVMYKGSGNGKNRELPISDDVVEYFRVMKQNSSKVFGRFVLTNRLGRPCARVHLTNAVTEAAKKLGLYGNVLYAMKHTLASKLRAQGTDLETIRQILGHTNLNTTQRYLQNIPTHNVVREALEKVR